MEKGSVIMAVYQERRSESAVQVQDVLTKYGCSIHVRLGLHDAGPDFCSNAGLMLLQLSGGTPLADEMRLALEKIPGVKVKFMALDF